MGANIGGGGVGAEDGSAAGTSVGDVAPYLHRGRGGGGTESAAPPLEGMFLLRT